MQTLPWSVLALRFKNPLNFAPTRSVFLLDRPSFFHRPPLTFPTSAIPPNDRLGLQDSILPPGSACGLRTIFHKLSLLYQPFPANTPRNDFELLNLPCYLCFVTVLNMYSTPPPPQPNAQFNKLHEQVFS